VTAGGERLTARLEQIVAEHEIARTISAYAHAVDYGDAEQVVDCFTEDGVFEVRSRRPGYPSRRIEGRQSLREFFGARTLPQDVGDKHLALQHRIALRGDEATCESYLVVVRDEDEEPVVAYAGRYHDVLVAEPDGRWRIRERIGHVESMRRGTVGRSAGAPPSAAAGGSAELS
jgi:ketosteroid isomerase-like protein